MQDQLRTTQAVRRLVINSNELAESNIELTIEVELHDGDRLLLPTILQGRPSLARYWYSV